ncbi:S-adenosyl-L-methionine-dependent methyltransferase [Irpex lacteus]|nr:S-adenosyl-L-methionine-dependent methyltransferase [Irpex lacteus]
MAGRSKSRDMKNARRRNRAQDEIPYPVVYSSDQLAHDNWNHMFLKSLSQGLTLRQYNTPPKDILDLGCGSGLWVMDAAQQWKTSNFIGYDCLRIQPDLSIVTSQPGFEDLAKRVQWVHGNFLDPLPFKANSFDFVRICGIGFGVPEDEWQSLFQEVARVLKPGAFIEIIEEDLIFPASGDSVKDTGSPSQTRRLKPLLEPISLEQSANTTASRTSNTSMKSPSVIASTLARFHSESPQPQASDTDRSSSPLPRPTISELLNPRDHSLLKAAWDEMLHKRFLAPGLLSVLHFYFSAEFEEVQSHPTIRILLPPNSQMTFSSDCLPSHRTRSTSISNTLEGITVAISEAAGPSGPSVTWNSSFDHVLEGYGPRREDTQKSGPVITTSWAAMHLSKAFSTVQGCKDAVWLQYKELQTVDENEPAEQELYNEFLRHGHTGRAICGTE